MDPEVGIVDVTREHQGIEMNHLEQGRQPEVGAEYHEREEEDPALALGTKR